MGTPHENGKKRLLVDDAGSWIVKDATGRWQVGSKKAI
jgi:hypothetical protein